MLLRSSSKCRPTFALPVVPIARYTRLARYTRSVARRGIVREPERQRSARRSHLWTTTPPPTAYARPDVSHGKLLSRHHGVLKPFLKLVATAIGHVPTNVRHDIDLMLGMGQLKAYIVDI